MRIFFRAACLALVLSSQIVLAGTWQESSRLPETVPVPLASDPLKATVHRLANGLTVYLSPNSQVPRVAARIVVRAGSSQDPSDSTGIAHYLEHMLFKGSSKLGTLDYQAEKESLDRISGLYDELFAATDTFRRRELYARIDEVNIAAARYAVPNELDRTYKTMGFDGVNAFTSMEATAYLCDMPKNRMEAWARLEADRFAQPVFRLFQSELEAVYEEKNRSLDDAGRILNQALLAGLFGGHPYGRPALGTVEHLRNPSLSKMRAFYRRFYVPNNMAIVLSGDFDRKKALSIIEKSFGALKPEEIVPSGAYEILKSTFTRRVEVRYEAEETVALAWQAPPFGHPDSDAVTVMDMVMDNSRSGILNLDLNQAQKVKRAGSSPVLLNEGGGWYMWAVPKDSQTLEEAEALLLGCVEKLKTGAFSGEELKAIITNFEIAEKLRLESDDSRAEAMAGAFLHFQEWPRAVQRLERLRRVTKADVVRAAGLYLGEGKAAVYRRKGKPEIFTLPKPGFTKIEIDPKRESAFFKEIVSMPAKPIEPRWLAEEKDFTRRQVPWGEIIAAKNPVSDLFSLSFVFERGSRHERELCSALDLAGLSGAGAMSAGEFKKTLYSLGTSLSFNCGEEASGVELSGLEANLEKSLRLTRLLFESPNISTDTLKKYIEVETGARKDNKTDPGYVMSALKEWAQRGKESSVLGELTDKELRGFDEARLKGVLRGFFDYKRRVGYVGLKSADEAVKLLDEPGKKFLPAPGPAFRRYRKPDKNEVFFTHRDMVQSQVGIFAPDGPVDPKKIIEYQYYDDYMDGDMSAVIFQEIRESRALAYSAHGGYAWGGRKGDENRVYGALGTQAEKTIEAAALLRDLLGTTPLSPARFNGTRKAMEEKYRIDSVTFRQTPDSVMEWEDLGLPGDPKPERFRQLLSYTDGQFAAFTDGFKSKRMAIYVLGNRDKVDLDGLKKLGEFTEKPIDELFPY